MAEIGAAFLCCRLRISLEPREDHAQYLANWLKVLKEDKKAIFTAAAKAQEAADYVLSPRIPEKLRGSFFASLFYGTRTPGKERP